jgi:hypothetical protein
MKKRFIPLMFSIILLGFATATSVSASTIHVPREEATIQAGIDAAANGDTVLVDPGTYFENINFNGKAITVSSAGGAAVTIVDGGNIAPVVTFSSGETTDSMLSGSPSSTAHPAMSRDIWPEGSTSATVRLRFRTISLPITRRWAAAAA